MGSKLKLIGIRNMSEELDLDHLGRDVLGKLLDLFADVSQEGLAGPSSDQHDCEDWAFAQVHGHSCS